MPDVPSFEPDQNVDNVRLSATNGAANRPINGEVNPTYWRDFFANGASSFNRPAVGFDTTNADQARTWQTQLMQDLNRQAAGSLDTRAQQSLTSGYGAARAGQMALGSAQRGTGGAAGLRAGVAGAGNIQRGFAGDQQMLKVQEQQGAQALLSQLLAQQRGQDAMQAQGMATNALGNMSLDDAMRQHYMQQGVLESTNAADLQAQLARARLGFDLEGQSINRDIANRASAAGATATGALMNMWNSQPKSSGFRQVDGQNSIVPEWDK